MTQYAWVRPKLYGDLDAQTAGEHLESLVEKYQEHLTADEILSDARRSQSPLHDAFEWNDSDAAERHRRSTATGIASSLIVRPKKGAKKMTRAFVFVRIPKHGRKCYMPVRAAMAQPELRQQVIEKALKQLERWVGLYGSQRSLRFVAKDVERLRRKIEIEYLTAAGLAV